MYEENKSTVANYYEGNSYNDGGITKHIPIRHHLINGELLITIKQVGNSGLFNKKRYSAVISLSNDFDEYHDEFLRNEIYKHAIAVINGKEKWENSEEIPKLSEVIITVKDFSGKSVTLDVMKYRDSIERKLKPNQDEYGYK